MSCFDLTHAPVATAARAAATGFVSMSTRPDPEGSDTVEIATRRCPRRSVGLARAHPLTKTQAMEPSRQTWSSYGPPYPLGRWSSRPCHTAFTLYLGWGMRRLVRQGKGSNRTPYVRSSYIRIYSVSTWCIASLDSSTRTISQQTKV